MVVDVHRHSDVAVRPEKVAEDVAIFALSSLPDRFGHGK